jgi:hypothetical protein
MASLIVMMPIPYKGGTGIHSLIISLHAIRLILYIHQQDVRKPRTRPAISITRLSSRHGEHHRQAKLITAYTLGRMATRHCSRCILRNRSIRLFPPRRHFRGIMVYPPSSREGDRSHSRSGIRPHNPATAFS